MQQGTKFSPSGNSHNDLVKFRPSLIKSMDLYKRKWAGIENILEGVEKLAPTVIQAVPNEPDLIRESVPSTGLSDTFMKHHLLYLRATVPLDFLIAKGKYTGTEELPERLRIVPCSSP